MWTMEDTPSDRLLKVRRKRFETAAECAAYFGWNPNTYKSHENGIRGISRKVAERYARGLGVSAAYILFGKRTRSGDLAPDEKALLEKYRRLTPSGRQAAHAFHDALAESDAEPPQPAVTGP